MRPTADITAENQRRVGDIVAALPVGEALLLVLGWQIDRFPQRGAIGDGSGRFAATVWRERTGGGARHWFIAAMKGAGIGALAGGAALSLRPDGEARPFVAKVPAGLATTALFATAIHEAVAGETATVDTLIGWILAHGDGPAVAPLVLDLVRRGRKPSGLVEVRGVVPGVGYVVQGWIDRPVNGPAGFLVNDATSFADAPIARFERRDLTPPATGFVALLPSPGAQRAGELARVAFRVDGRFGWLDIYEEGTTLRAEETGAWLGGIRGALAGEPSSIAALVRAVQGSYLGAETLAALGRPVRLAVDAAACIDRVGYFLSGWWVDPSDAAAAVTLRRRDGFVAPLDAVWSRVPRPDVVASLADDATLGPLLRGVPDRHGFHAFVADPGARAADDAFLAVAFDGETGYVPLRVEDGATATTRRKLLGRVDANAAWAETVIARHLGPFFAAGGGALRERPATIVRADRAPGGDIAVLVPARADDIEVVRAHLTQYAFHRLPAGATLVVAVGGDADAIDARPVVATLDFYDVPATVLAVADADDWDAVLAAALPAIAAEWIAVVSPRVFFADATWLARLRAALPRWPGAVAATPTLLHEDGSVRVGGDWTGFPATAIDVGDPAPVTAGTLDCCLVRRRTLAALVAAPSPFATQGGRARDLFARIGEGGGFALWVPTAHVFLVGEAEGGASWLDAARRADAWMLAQARSGPPPEPRPCAS